MSDVNVISVTGRLGRDAEKRIVGNGDSVVNGRIAVNGYKKDAPAMWIGVTIFGKRGETVAPYLVKGKRIAVVGRLQVREYEKKDGSKGTDVEIVASDVVLLDGGERREGGAQRAPAQRQGSQRDAAPDDFPDDDFGGGGGDDSDIPFMPWTLP